MAASIFSYQHRVTYGDCAPGNHVYYGRYLEFLEIVRNEFFRGVGSPFLFWQQQNTAFPVTHCQLAFKHPARYDDLLTLQVWVTELQRVRLGFAYRILHPTGQLILEGTTTHACAGADEKLKRLPEELKNALRPYLHEPG